MKDASVPQNIRRILPVVGLKSNVNSKGFMGFSQSSVISRYNAATNCFILRFASPVTFIVFE